MISWRKSGCSQLDRGREAIALVIVAADIGSVSTLGLETAQAKCGPACEITIDLVEPPPTSTPSRRQWRGDRRVTREAV